VDDVRVGRIVRALRRRKAWRQLDLATAAGCSQSLISLVERGHIESLSLRALRRIFRALEVRDVLELSWRGAALDRLLDEDHARVVGIVAAELRRRGWLVELEVTYARFGERGSIDILCFHPASRTLLVIEVKTDLPSTEATLRKLDEKVRLAAAIVRERFGWDPVAVARILVMPDRSSLRRRVARHAGVFNQSLPLRGQGIHRWLRSPSGSVSGLWFLSISNGRSDKQASPAPTRVRTRKRPPPSAGPVPGLLYNGRRRRAPA
jgi:transcriptional regulator with XRE-family HTH domain